MKETQSVLSRREALKVIGTGTAAMLSAESCSGQPRRTEPKQIDVAVIGAGFAGMIAARNLRRAGKNVVLLEARDRVGGRVKAGTIAGKTVDVGGMWVGPTQTKLLALVKEYGTSVYAQYESGNSLTELGGRRTYGKEEDTGLDRKTEHDLDSLIKELDGFTAEIPLGSPWSARRAAEFDSMTVDEWITARTANEALRGFSVQ